MLIGEGWVNEERGAAVNNHIGRGVKIDKQGAMAMEVRACCVNCSNMGR